MFRQDSWVEKRPPRKGTKRIRWQPRYTDPQTGKRLGGPIYDYKREAEKWLRDTLGEIDDGQFISPVNKQGTVDEWAEVWWDTRARRLMDQTKRPYHQKWKAYISPKLGPEKLADITYNDVENFITYLQEDRGLGGKTIREILGVLIAIFDTAITSRQPPRHDNPARNHKVTIRKRKRRPGDTLNMAQAILFVEHSVHQHYRTAVWLSLYMGVRPAELWGIHVRDVNWEDCVIDIEQTYYPVPAYGDVPAKKVEGPVKEDSNRSVPIPAWLRDDLEAMLKARYGSLNWRRDDDYLFLNGHHQPVNRDTFQQKIMRPAIERAGRLAQEMGVRFPATFGRAYDMRHSSVTIALSAGENPHEVADRHGHDMATMFRVYAHIQENAQRGITDRLDAAFHQAREEVAAQLAQASADIIPFKGRQARTQPPVSG